MFRYNSLLLSSCLALCACQSEPKNSAPTPTYAPADINLRATSDLTAPAPIRQISFVPNNVASWLSHIIMVDSNGDIHRASTNSKVILVKKGSFKDVIGLDRPNKAGAFLALTESGRLQTYIEADNDGNFKVIPLSAPEISLQSFCQTSTADERRIFARADNGDIRAYDIEFFDENSANLTLAADAQSEEACQPLKVKEDGPALTLKPDSPYLNFGGTEAEIINGLSIKGLTTPSYVALTHENMGSVFADGALIAADGETGRLTLIARSYLLESLAAEN